MTAHRGTIDLARGRRQGAGPAADGSRVLAHGKVGSRAEAGFADQVRSAMRTTSGGCAALLGWS
ncbi:MAG: hypothetical protein ABJB47_03315 [Actinomycetota bacterium]